jgi:hypothetical protein
MPQNVRAAIKAASLRELNVAQNRILTMLNFLPLRTFGRNRTFQHLCHRYLLNVPLIGDTQRSNSMSPLSLKADECQGMHRARLYEMTT